MKPSDVTDFVATIADAYPERFRVTPSLTRLWALMLADLEPQDAMRALQAHLAESPHVPTIADIRRRVAECRVSPIDVGGAWGEVQRAVASVGSYRTPTFDNPAVAYAVECLGWKAICHTLQDDLPTLRAQFERYLRGYQDGQRRAANVGALEAHRERTGALGAGEVVAGLLGQHRQKGGA